MDKYEEIRRLFDESPYARLLGMTLEELSEGYARASMEMRREFLNWTGRAPGGLIASLADQAGGCAMNTLGRHYVLVQYNINYVASPEEGSKLVAEARAINRGGAICFNEATVFDDRGRMIAYATSTVAAMDRRP